MICVALVVLPLQASPPCSGERGSGLRPRGGQERGRGALSLPGTSVSAPSGAGGRGLAASWDLAQRRAQEGLHGVPGAGGQEPGPVSGGTQDHWGTAASAACLSPVTKTVLLTEPWRVGAGTWPGPHLCLGVKTGGLERGQTVSSQDVEDRGPLLTLSLSRGSPYSRPPPSSHFPLVQSTAAFMAGRSACARGDTGASERPGGRLAPLPPPEALGSVLLSPPPSSPRPPPSQAPPTADARESQGGRGPRPRGASARRCRTHARMRALLHAYSLPA